MSDNPPSKYELSVIAKRAENTRLLESLFGRKMPEPIIFKKWVPPTKRLNTTSKDDLRRSSRTKIKKEVDWVESSAEESSGEESDPEYQPPKTKLRIEKLTTRPVRRCATNISYKRLTDYYPEEDNFIYCEECGNMKVDGCDLHPLYWVADTIPDKNLPEPEKYASLTLPFETLALSKSNIKNSGLGVYTDADIAKNTVFGPYVGQIKSPQEHEAGGESGYEWEVYASGDRATSLFVDGSDPACSNWMRYVNCAVEVRQQNLQAFQYKGQIFYKVIKNVSPGFELMVYYGDEYGQNLGIQRYNEDPSAGESWVTELVGKTCPECGRDCASNSAMQKHYKSHAGIRKFSCGQCDARFVWESALKIHMRYHNEERPFSCVHCDASFVQKCDLKIHMRCHTGERPFSCVHCDTAFTRSGDLKIHTRLHTGELPFKCSQCKAAYTRPDQLRAHMSEHNGEKNHRCPHCQKTFGESGNLQKHIRSIHQQVKFTCEHEQCGKQFTQASVLRTHIRSAHEKIRVSCTVANCGKDFTETGHMTQHILKHHPKSDWQHQCLSCGERFHVAIKLKKHSYIC